MPDDFILRYVGFDDAGQPFFECQMANTAQRISVLGRELSLAVDTSTRFCTGWLDIINKSSHACPDAATVDTKYDSCIACRNRTGFNPAFYNATDVSEQQQHINQQPHFVYIAYFAPGVIKVGISQAARGIRRLLEQGARAAMQLETFPTALIARHYEAKIAQLPGIAEHLPQHKKTALLAQPFDASLATTELQECTATIERQLGVQFPQAALIDTETHFYQQPIDVTAAAHIKQPPAVVGRAVAMIGPLLISEWQGDLVSYDMKKLLGYRMASSADAAITLPESQLTLF